MAGRPTEYKDEYCIQVEKLCKLGATDKEIADFFDVEESTINNWKIAHPEFLESVKKGKIWADAEVAHSFHKRATGYKYDEVTYEKIAEAEDGMKVDNEGDIEDTKKEIYKRKVVTKEVPPDGGSALNWLKNRQKDKWRDKQEIESTNINYNSKDLTPDEIKAIGKALEDEC
jgi:hypothetical protein